MNIVFMGKSFNESGAAVRLYRALSANGMALTLIAEESRIHGVCLYKPSLFYKKFLVRVRKYFLKYTVYQKIKEPIHLPWTFDFMSPNPLKILKTIDTDIVHLHWIAKSFMDLHKLIYIKKPIVWTLHDVWPITGGCHCNMGCEKWENGCGSCPQIQSTNPDDLSRKFWNRKKKTFLNIPRLTVIAPSRWLEKKVRKSSFFQNARIIYIPNCIDTDVFFPLSKDDRNKLRKDFNIPVNKKVILFGANYFNKAIYKGFDLLLESLKYISSKKNNYFHLLLFGEEKIPNKINELPTDYTVVGRLSGEKIISKIYNTADVFVGPSRQDNFPGTFLEAAACGIPAVGFEVGGIPEIVEHHKTGYIAKPFDTSDLAKGIIWCLENNQNNKLGLAARDKVVNNFSFDIIAKKHTELYRGIIDNHNK